MRDHTDGVAITSNFLLFGRLLRRAGPLTREMARFRRSCERLLWLDPLAGRLNFEPLAEGLVAALPHYDLFLPCAALTPLEHLAELPGTPGRERRRQGRSYSFSSTPHHSTSATATTFAAVSSSSTSMYSSGAWASLMSPAPYMMQGIPPKAMKWRMSAP